MIKHERRGVRIEIGLSQHLSAFVFQVTISDILPKSFDLF